MNRKLVKLPDGRVLQYRQDPMARYLVSDVAKGTPSVPSSLVQAGEADHGRVPPASNTSRSPVLNMQLLDHVEVLVIGAGAVGSYVAYFLAAAASLIIHLVDFDVVEHKHTQGGRTIYHAGQVRQKKVYAAKDLIERHFPNSSVQPYPYNVLQIPDAQLRLLAKRAAIVVNAIDDPEGMLKINDLFYFVIEVLYVGLHHGAHSGHVVLTVPYASACLRCSLDIASASDIQTLHGEPGLGMDIRLVANYAAIIALELMYSKVTGQPVSRWDLTKNIFYFANRREQSSPDGPGLVLQRAEKRLGCPICSTAPNNLL